MHIRSETAAEWSAIRTVNEAAFDTAAEANLVKALRKKGSAVVSLVAELDGEIVGHILFSPVTLGAHPEAKLMGLAPMAVVPEHQGNGIGSALVREGLERCRQLGSQAVVVLGHAHYYPRFGFVPAVRYRIRSEYDVPEDVFMIVELQPGALTSAAGTIRYDDAFAHA